MSRLEPQAILLSSAGVVAEIILYQIRAPLSLMVIILAVLLVAAIGWPWIESTARRKRVCIICLAGVLVAAPILANQLNERAQPHLLVTLDGKDIKERKRFSLIDKDGHFKFDAFHVTNLGKTTTASGLSEVLYFSTEVIQDIPRGELQPIFWTPARSAEPGFAIVWQTSGSPLGAHEPCLVGFFGKVPNGAKEVKVMLRIGYGASEPYKATFTVN